MPIHILSPEVANQIAAGEVVERPASAVKELIENSLDADGRDIRVEIRDGGRRLIRVQDDGCGIPASEAALAFQRHATSKIRTAEDLSRITTLGFRGEALASIAAVSQVTLLTRARDDEIGVLLRMAEGREISREPAGGPAGAVVTVEHLFANTPARLKFLKQPATEAGHVQQMVTRYALAFPERRFSLVADGRLIFQSNGSGKLYDVLVKVYGLDMARQMLEVEHIDQSTNLPIYQSAIRVTGYVGSPSLHRGNRGYITLFVNRRWFQDTSVAFSVIQAYHTMLPTGRYPAAVVFIEIDPADVDVNVHPTKAEVRFRDNHAVFSAVQKAVRRTLIEHGGAAMMPAAAGAEGLPAGPDPAAAPSPSAWGGESGLRPTRFDDASWAQRRDALLGAGSQRRLFPSPDADAAGWAVGLQPPTSNLQPPTSSLQPPASKPLLPLLRVVGQLGATYIVAEGPDGMYLVDQHAAHERILYEQMTSQRLSHALAIQPLLEPMVLDLSPEQAAVVAEGLDTLNELGVAIEPFGGGSYLVRSVPAILSRDDPASALTEIVDGLAQQTDVIEGAVEAMLTTLICKRAAIKGGQVLSQAEMHELVRQLEACRAPRTCPHGRPTMIYLSADELARQFGRT
ncbi:MAG: DNA mismatch repair endonuclease MutL [Chloroflexi bacterium]|nr:DNA mismatch repair endonuclease MutL [Chloroflexota bacterium]